MVGIPTKGNVNCMDDLIELLNRKYCIFILTQIAEHPGATKTEILNIEPGNERSKFLRIGDLIDHGLVTMDDRNRKHNTIKLYLSPMGQEIVKCIKTMIDIYNNDKNTKS